MSHVKVRLEAIRDKGARIPGYVQDVLASSSAVTPDHAILTREAYSRLVDRYARNDRCHAGTALKALLATVGIRAAPTCSCNARAREMDARGCEWCEANINTIVGWLREESRKRGLPFVDAAGRLIVRRAIRKARRAAKT